MKILFISPIGAFFSGAEVATGNLMSYMQSQGHQVYNVIPDNGEHVDEAYIRFMTDHNIALYQFKTNKWWWSEAYQVKENDKVSLFAYQHKNIFQIRQLIKEKDIELVISNTVNVFQGAIAAALESVPHYHIIHEFPIGQFSYYKEKIELIDYLSDKIFAVSGGLYEELAQYFPQEKLYPFIPYSQLDKFELAISDKKRIVSIGGISQWKNQLELLQAFTKVKYSDVELVFIGGWEPEYKIKLDNYISENDLGSKVTFLGYQRDPFKLLSNKDILVLTSKVETFGLVYVESILSAVPAIVSDNSGHKTVSEFFSTKNIYPLGSVDSLAEKINLLLENFDSEKRMALDLSQDARERYTLGTTSQVFIDQLVDVHQIEARIGFKGLSSLLGWNLSDDILESISHQYVTVYHSNERPFYKIETYEIKQEDNIIIEVEDADFIRIDLTEEAGFYSRVEMLDQVSGLLLEPVHTNAYNLSNKLLFLDNDPQLVYDTKDLHHHQITFSYVKSDFSELTTDVQKVLKDQEELARLSNIEARYHELEHEYHSVVNSRRWTIPTKIINFFRRK